MSEVNNQIELDKPMMVELQPNMEALALLALGLSLKAKKIFRTRQSLHRSCLILAICIMVAIGCMR